MIPNMRQLIMITESAAITVSRHIEDIGNDDTKFVRETYVIHGVPGLEADLKVLDYRPRSPGRVVQTIEVWPENHQGQGYAQKLYLAALEHGPLNERPQFQSANATRAIDRMLAKGIIKRVKDDSGSPILISV